MNCFIKLTAANGGVSTLVHILHIKVIRRNRQGGVSISMRDDDFTRDFTESLEEVERKLSEL